MLGGSWERRPSMAAITAWAIVATVTIGVGALVVVSASSEADPTELSSHSPMLQPYFSWEAEEKAKLREHKEEQALSTDTDADTDADDAPDLDELNVRPKVVVGKAPIKQEMLSRFHVRDELKAMNKQMRVNDIPRESTAAKLASDKSRLKQLRKRLAILRHKHKRASAVLRAKDSVADPILRKAQNLFTRQQNLQHQGTYEENHAQDQIEEGKEMIQRSIMERKEFLGDEAPIEAAQNEAHDASVRYRRDALAYADAMVAAEKVANNPKMHAAMEKKLDALRAKMAMAQQQRKVASHKLELAQMAMHDEHGVNHYAGLRSRGHKLIREGEQLADNAQQYQREAALMHGRVARAQSVAAKQEAGVQEKRDIVQKLDASEKRDLKWKHHLERDAAQSKARLRRLEKRETELRLKGAKLMKRYEALQQDINSREKARSQQIAKMAADNSKKLNNLLDEEK